ncbi:carbohydrate ABC transporter permease [Actinomadura parmotrematis]|uniref:Carbohydrate ABC transporter permease n=1 Tax=Actinomadura parmotrematis TaxID=2864039 RepID=A0ABS7FSZ2_9ACTN|nr:carbohydrate ABC transporter permease [Actinomadura parmotrematis]MBW8483524.1 carbohydrate ABC transporter permease [Actinomadura parmotrematis]
MTTNVTPAAPPVVPVPSRRHRRAARRRAAAPETRTLVSRHALGTTRGKIVYWLVLAFVLVTSTFVFVFPLYWMVTGAMRSPNELAQVPPDLLPRHFDLSGYKEAWRQLDLGLYLRNTAIYAGGAWLFTLGVDVTAAYALSKLRPVLGRAILGLMLATLMIPPMVIILPAYLTVKDLPLLHVSLLNTPWAIWLPAAANAFNIFLLKRFFDSIPTELLEAAEMDGASPLRVLWSVVLPVSRPILGVVSIFTVVNVWRDFVWPLLVQSDPQKRTVSTAISSLAVQVPENVLIASLVIASLPTIVVFFVFQRHIMAGLTAGGLKG